MLSTVSKFLRLAQPSQGKYFSIANSQPAKYDADTPVWMKTYDAAKYEVPIKHQKVPLWAKNHRNIVAMHLLT
jgi:hypothetical protein